MPAKRPRTVTIRRNEENQDILFYGSRTPLTRRELHDALEGHVRAWLRAACIWRQLAIGDYRSLLFSFEAAPGVYVYVQFWSEPAEPVRWEVSSGRTYPPTGAWLAGERAQRIEALGFTIGGGKAQDYRRDVDVTTPAEAAAIAREVVTIFYDAFEYRGLQPITVRLLHEGRTELKPTFHAFTPRDVSKVFAGLGFRIEEPHGEDEVAPPVIRCRKRATTTFVHFWDQVEGDDLYARVRFEADIELPEEERRLHEDILGARDDEDPYTTVSVVHAFSGGVTLEWLMARIGEWDAMLREGRRAVRRGRTRRPTHLPASETIH